MRALRIGTRGSPLALWQARAVEAAISRAGGPSCELAVIKTTGDQRTATSLSEVGGKRLFVKEIEEALLDGSVDVAVHSAKDLPVDLPPGLTIGATLRRGDPRDALTLPSRHQVKPHAKAVQLMTLLGPSPRIGTGSVRRIAQLSSTFRGSTFLPIRGNVETRLRKLDTGGYDGLVLATAGLIRLGLTHRISARLSFDECVPAPGQGIVAVEVRASDDVMTAMLTKIGDRDTMASLEAERAVVLALGGGCQTPIGAIATRADGGLTLQAVVASLDGTSLLRRSARGQVDTPTALGERVARELISDGAEEILAQHRP